MVSKTDIIARLQREIMPLQGYKPRLQPAMDQGIGMLAKAFPGQQFPLGAIHEYHCRDMTDLSVTSGFIAGLLQSCHLHEGAIVWVSASRHIYPPALAAFGIRPEQVIFVVLPGEKERLWAIEEALKCNAIQAVVGENRSISFTTSRRFQLAVEKSGVTGFMIRDDSPGATTSIAKWRIRSRPSIAIDQLPGVGYPSWGVDLCKVRNGQTGTWQLAWAGERFVDISVGVTVQEAARKTG